MVKPIMKLVIVLPRIGVGGAETHLLPLAHQDTEDLVTQLVDDLQQPAVPVAGHVQESVPAREVEQVPSGLLEL